MLDLRQLSEELRGDIGFNSHSATGSLLLNSVGPQLVAHIQDIRDSMGKRRPIFISMTDALSAEQLAILMIVTALDNLAKPMSKASLSHRLGQFIQQELNYDSMRDSNPDLFDKLTRKAISHRVRRTLDECVTNGVLRAEVTMTKDVMINVGLGFVQILVDTGLLDEEQFPTTKGSITKVFWSPATVAWQQTTTEDYSFCNPVSLPLVTKPLGYDAEGKEHSYGQSFPPIPFRLSSPFFQRAEYGTTIEAADKLAQVPYRIHEGVFNTVKRLWDLGISVGKLGSSDRLEIPPYPKGESEESIKDWKRVASGIHIKNAIGNSSYVNTKRTLRVSSKFLGKPLYFLYQADGRGRLYPVTSTLLNPQGSDLSKGILEFYDKKPLGSEGLFYLYAHTAEMFGVDKTSYTERVAWTAKNLSMVSEVARSPVEALEHWKDSDSPFEFLQACMELVAALALDKPETYESGLIKNMDGRCSGAQHYTGLLKHKGTAEQVGMVPSSHDDLPPDIYSKVLMGTVSAINAAAKRGDDMAGFWSDAFDKGFATRNLAKRPTMTYLYTATTLAFANHVMELSSEFGLNGVGATNLEQWKDMKSKAFYLAKLMEGVIEEVMSAPAQAMKWLERAAKAVTKGGGEVLEWVSPSGFTVRQSYTQTETAEAKIRCKIFNRALKIKYQKDTAKLNSRKQGSALCANYIHSFDASHLVATVLDFAGDIRVIHDSFGVHLSEVNSLRYSLKSTFIAQYSTDHLEVLKGDWEDRYGVTLPETPAKGDLDLDGMMDSVYDFS